MFSYVNLSLVLFASLILVALGVAKTALHYKKLKNEAFTLSGFLGEFWNWHDGGMQDRTQYLNIVSASPKIQAMTRQWGLIEYNQPLSRNVLRNWPVFLNAIPVINQYSNNGLGSGIADIHINLVSEALARAIGDTECRMQALKSSVINPLRMFRKGIDFVLELPIMAMRELGLISSGLSETLPRSTGFRAAGIGITTSFFLALGAPVHLGQIMTNWAAILDRLAA